MLTAVLVARAWGCSLVPNTRMEVHLCVGFHFVKCDLLAVCSPSAQCSFPQWI